MRFRDKSFIAFLSQQGLSPMVWLMFIFGGLISAGLFALDISYNRFPIGGMLFLVGVITVYLAFNCFEFMMYKKGLKAIRQLKAGSSSTLIKNTRVYIKNWTILSVKKAFPPDIINKTIYDFSYADLLVNPSAILLMGIRTNPIVKGYSAPILLYRDEDFLYPNSAKIISAKLLKSQKVELIIKDPNFIDEIALLFPINEELKEWYMKNYR